MKRALLLACGLAIGCWGVMVPNAVAADTPGCLPDPPDRCAWQPGSFPTSVSVRGSVGQQGDFAYSSGTATGQGQTVVLGTGPVAPMFRFVKTVPADATDVAIGYDTSEGSIDTDVLRSFPNTDQADWIVLRISEPSGCAGDYTTTYTLGPQGFGVACAFAMGEPRRVRFEILHASDFGDAFAGLLNLSQVDLLWTR